MRLLTEAGRAPRKPSLEAGGEGLLSTGKTKGGVASWNMEKISNKAVDLARETSRKNAESDTQF